LPLNRTQKEGIIAGYAELFTRSQALIFVDYRGLSVAALSALRTQIRESGNSFLVVKNTLALKALEDAGKSVPDDLFFGPVAIGVCMEDIATVAKAMNKAASDTKLLTVRGALLGQTFVDATQARALADLPSREELLAKVVGSMQAPITGLVNVLAGPLRGLVNVLNGRKDQLAA
jgi:large subunit ribosomal protein L10